MSRHLSCVWNANGSFSCDKVCNGVICHDAYEHFVDKTTMSPKMVYSINIIVTNLEKSVIYYEKKLPSISAINAYVLDTIYMTRDTLNYSQALLEIQDMTNYEAQQLLNPPLLQLLVQNSQGTTYNLQFNSKNGLNVLMRTNTITIPTIGTTTIMLDRHAMNI